MGLQINAAPGHQAVGGTSQQANLRTGGQGGELMVSELHGRFYEQVFQGNVYSFGHTAVMALSANTITLTATTTPILGIWNPPTSGKNFVIWQVALQDFINNVTSVALGEFVWATSTGNAAISTGSLMFNRKTLTAAGGQMKGFSGAALTGLTNNLVLLEAAEFPTASGLLTTTVAAATPTPSVGATINYDGSLWVPPGGVLALLNTVSTTTHSVYGRVLCEEVAIT